MSYPEQLDVILDCVCKIGGVSVERVCSRERTAYVADLRGVYCLLARELVDRHYGSTAIVARRLNRDHSTCCYLCKRTRNLLDVGDKVVTALYTEVRDNLINSENLTKKIISFKKM